MSKRETLAPTPDELEAQAEPLMPASALEEPIGDIPLPPEELVDALDNSDAGRAEPAEAPEVATLDFCGDALPFERFPLAYPFRLDGEPVDAITVHQLTTQQMGELYRDLARTRRLPELMDVYAKMCRLPAAVLRALPAADGEPITARAYDFLPPLLRPEGE